MTCLRRLPLFFSLLFAVQWNAQQYFFRNYSAESGLPFVQVFCMYQDSNGYLWSGGYGGLSRFDGKGFTNYNRKNGLVDHNVNAISADGRGTIYVGTNKGLSILRDGVFTNYPSFGDYERPRITSLCKGYHHSVYIGTPKGLYMFKSGEIKKVKRFSRFSINCLYNPDTNVIFAGTDQGLVIFGHNTYTVIGREHGLAASKVSSVVRFRNFLVAGTTNGLSLYDLSSKKITNYYESNGLIDENIEVVHNEGDRFLWVGSKSGLMRFDGKSFEYYRIAKDNNSNQVRCILGDREDNIWFGTHSGLYRYRDNSFATFDDPQALATAFIFQIFRDSEGDLWACTQNGGIFRQRKGQFTRYGPEKGVTSNTCRAGLETRNGRLLFGAGTELLEFGDEKFRKLPLDTHFTGEIDVMYESDDGTVWLGGDNGVCAVKLEQSGISTRFYPISGADFQVFGFCQDEKKNLYVGTSKAGLFRMDGDTLISVNRELNLTEETFFTLRYVQGHIFAASLNGVLDLEPGTGKLSRITDLEGLSSELVYSLEFSRDMRYLWIGTNQGINRLDLQTYLRERKIRITTYGRQEGFSGIECNGNGIWEDPDGTLWFGTVSGLVRHQPANYKPNLTPNKTLIQSIRIMNEDSLLNDSAELASDLNTISFYYRGICLTNPERVLYQRRLVGLEQDENWSAPATESYIKYTNLAPGRYTFMVRSRNNEGIWDKSPAIFSFRILPPFYLTWWFILLCVLGLFAVIYAVFMIRIYNIKKKQRLEYERKVELSKIELKALRAQMNPHFVFNSLNSIQHYIFHTKSDEAIKYLNKFARLVRIILNNSDKPTVTVGEDLEALKLYLELEKMRFEDKFDYEVIVDGSVDPDYDIMPPLLMQPYVENAILHGLNPKPTRGKLTLRLHSENNFLICTITDNGIGRERAKEIRRTMPIRKHRSMGMKITEDRLRILNEASNSKLSVTITDLYDALGRAAGTKVEIYVPLSG